MSNLTGGTIIDNTITNLDLQKVFVRSDSKNLQNFNETVHYWARTLKSPEGDPLKPCSWHSGYKNEPHELFDEEVLGCYACWDDNNICYDCCWKNEEKKLEFQNKLYKVKLYSNEMVNIDKNITKYYDDFKKTSNEKKLKEISLSTLRNEIKIFRKNHEHYIKEDFKKLKNLKEKVEVSKEDADKSKKRFKNIMDIMGENATSDAVNNAKSDAGMYNNDIYLKNLKSYENYKNKVENDEKQFEEKDEIFVNKEGDLKSEIQKLSNSKIAEIRLPLYILKNELEKIGMMELSELVILNNKYNNSFEKMNLLSMISIRNKWKEYYLKITENMDNDKINEIYEAQSEEIESSKKDQAEIKKGVTSKIVEKKKKYNPITEKYEEIEVKEGKTLIQVGDITYNSSLKEKEEEKEEEVEDEIDYSSYFNDISQNKEDRNISKRQSQIFGEVDYAAEAEESIVNRIEDRAAKLEKGRNIKKF